MPQDMRKAGFVDVRVEKWKWPHKRIEGVREADLAADYNRELMSQTIQGIASKTLEDCGSGYGKVRGWIERIPVDLNSDTQIVFWLYFGTVGRKPV